MKRWVFFVSDSTALTAKAFGDGILSRFQDIAFESHIIPFVNTEAKMDACIQTIHQKSAEDATKSIVFTTLINYSDQERLTASVKGLVVDVFSNHLRTLTKYFGQSPIMKTDLAHAIKDTENYEKRINALDFSLTNDDGQNTEGYEKADIILVGPSRSGKTPTSIYMAMHYRLFCANYPIMEEESAEGVLPECLRPYQDKVYGLTCSAQHLRNIREKRLDNSTYASLEQCQREIKRINNLYEALHVPYLDTTHTSVEEISAHIFDWYSSK